MCRQTAGCNDGGLCRQTAVCNARTVKAYRRAWWKLPRGIRSILRVLSVWRLANGRLERPNNRGHFKGFKGFKRLKAGKRQAWTPQQQRGICRQTAGCRLGYAGKRQAATLEQQRLTAGLGGRSILGVLRVLRVWRLAKGRLGHVCTLCLQSHHTFQLL